MSACIVVSMYNTKHYLPHCTGVLCVRAAVAARSPGPLWSMHSQHVKEERVLHRTVTKGVGIMKMRTTCTQSVRRNASVFSGVFVHWGVCFSGVFFKGQQEADHVWFCCVLSTYVGARSSGIWLYFSGYMYVLVVN